MLVEENAGRRRGVETVDRFKGPASTEGDHRRPAGLRLDRHDAEILFGREHECLGALQVIAQFRLGSIAQETHVRPGLGADLVVVGAVADDDQRPVGHRREGLDDDVDALVRDEPRRGHVEVFFAVDVREAFDVDRRIDDIGIAAVGLGDALADEARVGDEAVDAVRGAQIPQAKLVQEPLGRPALQPAVESGLAQVLVLQVPGVAHWRMHIADVELARPGEHALGDRMRARDHQIVAGEVVLLDGERHQRQVAAVALLCARKVLDEGGLDRFVLDEPAQRLRQEIDDAEEIGIGKHLDQLLEHTFRTRIVHQPLVHERNALALQAMRQRAHSKSAASMSRQCSSERLNG